MRNIPWLVLVAAVATLGCFEPTPGDGSECAAIEEGTACKGTPTCTWGGQACQCGVCNPAYGCACDGGFWRCWHTDPIPEAWCPDVVQSDVPVVPIDASADVPELPAACPAEPPIGVAATCESGTRCEYGEECCCGVCHPSMVCHCSGGT